VGFLQWNNLFKNIPASDKALTKALQKVDFLTFKEPGEMVSTSTKSYLDFTLSDSDAENRKKIASTNIPRKSSTTLPSPSSPSSPAVVNLHSSAIPTDSKQQNNSGATRKPRKGSNITKTSMSKPSSSVPPVLPTGARPSLPTKGIQKDKRAVVGLRPAAPTGKLTTHRRSRADTSDSDVSAVSSVGDLGELGEVTDMEEPDYGAADADIPKSTAITTTTTTTTSPPTVTSTSSPATVRIDDDDDEDTNESIIARANAVWS